MTRILKRLFCCVRSYVGKVLHLLEELRNPDRFLDRHWTVILTLAESEDEAIRYNIEDVGVLVDSLGSRCWQWGIEYWGSENDISAHIPEIFTATYDPEQDKWGVVVDVEIHYDGLRRRLPDEAI
jgi:hypothetical protein